MAEEKIAIEKGEATPEQIEEIEAGQYMTLAQIAHTLNYSRQRITILVQQGRIRAVKPVGGQWRVARSEFERLKNKGMPPMPRERKKPPATVIEVSEEQRVKVAPEAKAKVEEGKKSVFPLDFSKLFGG